MDNQSRLMHLLLVEDDEAQAYLVKRNMSKGRLANTLDHVVDGEGALKYLRREEPYTDSARPDLILLDLKLPKIDGHEVLAEIKEDPRLRIIPVVVLTTSDAETDRAKAYEYHANSYIVKPLDATNFQELIDQLNRYWGLVNSPPPPADSPKLWDER